MRLKYFSAILMALALACAPARAQLLIPQSDTQKPDLTAPLTVALIYYRFSGQTPDFNAWALLTDDYKNAAVYEKMTVQEKKAHEFSQNFDLLAAGEPIIVDFPAQISDYSLKNEGYLIENFTSDMFFPFTYAGENYAVIPKGAIDKQWLPVKDMAAKQIDDLRHLSKSGDTVTVTLSLAPKFADKSPPVTIKGVPYRLISADIKTISFFDAKGALVWRQDQTQAAGPSPAQQKLLNLYK